MPFKVFKNSTMCSVSHPYGVFTIDANGKAMGRPHGCHPTPEAARKQQAALFANVPDARK